MCHQLHLWPRSWEATCQPARRLGDIVSWQVSICTTYGVDKPAERWEGASVWPPTISLLLGSSSMKGLQISTKKYLVCVRVSSGDILSPRHCRTVVGCCSVEHLVPSMCLSQSNAKERCLGLAATLISLLWESLAPTPGKKPCDQAGRQHSRLNSPSRDL